MMKSAAGPIANVPTGCAVPTSPTARPRIRRNQFTTTTRGTTPAIIFCAMPRAIPYPSTRTHTSPAPAMRKNEPAISKTPSVIKRRGL